MKPIKFLLLTFLLTFTLVSCKWLDGIFNPPPPLPPTSQGISGTARDNNSGKEIEGAVVTITGGDNKKSNRTTLSDGKFSFTSQEIGNYTLDVVKVGYKTETVSLSVAAEQTTNKDVTLKKAFEISPEAGLDFAANEKVKKFDLKNNTDKTIGFTIKVNNPWITVEPTSGSIPGNSIFPITVTVDDKGRIPAKYDGALTLNFDSNVDSRNYNISMFVPNNEAPSVVCDKPTNITRTSAQVLGTITSIGKGPVTRHGHVWSENPNPTCCVPGFYTDFGARGVGQYVSSIGPLVSGKKYYVKAYAFNEKGMNPSVEEFTFTTSITATAPDVTINSITNITTNTAKIVAKINNDGGASISSYGVVWSKRNESTTPDPRVQKTKTEVKSTPGNSEFVANIEGLEPNTEYYISAYAYNSSSTDPGIGKAISFNTAQPVAEAKLTTAAASDIDYTDATLKGSITDLGSVKIVEHGFVYSKSNADPRINGKNCAYKNLGNVNMNSATPFPVSAQVTGLFKGMSYYYRTYIKNENGQYSYSASIKTFTTKEDNLVYFWNLDEGLSDISGNSNHANGTAKPVTDRFLNASKARDLSSGMLYETQSSKINISTELTVSFWIKLSDGNFSGSKKILYGHSTEWCQYEWNWSGFFIYFDPTRPEGANNILLLIKDRNNFNETIQSVVSKDDIELNQWQHFAMVKSGINWSFYINGELVSTKIFNINTWNLFNNRSFVGVPSFYCKEDNFGNPISQIDEIRRYNKAFSSAQVLDLYNREK